MFDAGDDAMRSLHGFVAKQFLQRGFELFDRDVTCTIDHHRLGSRVVGRAGIVFIGETIRADHG